MSVKMYLYYFIVLALLTSRPMNIVTIILRLPVVVVVSVLRCIFEWLIYY